MVQNERKSIEIPACESISRLIFPRYGRNRSNQYRYEIAHSQLLFHKKEKGADVFLQSNQQVDHPIKQEILGYRSLCIEKSCQNVLNAGFSGNHTWIKNQNQCAVHWQPNFMRIL